ncbi:SDR family oxidoreductase [Sulfitobacter sp. HNIBRBA3233]|uniref:SDR family NAD(P)-dependent oxidoreductase n=1 Tax=Sulfitobacter marinivivus TaxID=3158558 RepID=UPI0032DF1C77
MSRPLCLITGASGGIGAACALRAAEEGYDLVLTYNGNRDGAEETAAQARALGADVAVRQTDVADPQAIHDLFAQIDDLGPLAALVNNAGITAPPARAAELTHDRLRAIFDVNVIGAMLVAGAAVRRMVPRKSGAIVNITSIAARTGAPDLFVDYAASKAALETYSKGLALEVAGAGVRVNAVAPGLIDTDIHARSGDPGRLARTAPNVPLGGRAGTAREVADAVLYLLSDAASYITGTTLDVTGGR